MIKAPKPTATYREVHTLLLHYECPLSDENKAAVLSIINVKLNKSLANK